MNVPVVNGIAPCGSREAIGRIGKGSISSGYNLGIEVNHFFLQLQLGQFLFGGGSLPFVDLCLKTGNESIKVTVVFFIHCGISGNQAFQVFNLAGQSSLFLLQLKNYTFSSFGISNIYIIVISGISNVQVNLSFSNIPHNTLNLEHNGVQAVNELFCQLGSMFALPGFEIGKSFFVCLLCFNHFCLHHLDSQLITLNGSLYLGFKFLKLKFQFLNLEIPFFFHDLGFGSFTFSFSLNQVCISQVNLGLCFNAFSFC